MACVKLNWLCVLLSPIAIILIFLYSITKRFTAFSHFFLGLALGVAPIGAWVAVQGNLMSFTPFLLALAVVFWVAGFDLIYALQDMDFDKETGLFSFPAKYGLKATLRLSSFLHLLAVGMMGVLGWIVQLNWMYWLAWVAIVACIAVEQKWARTGRVDLMNRAFFHVNAIVSVLVLAGIGASVWMTSF
jgi:4-hydroxybenzoate polyprenyltransferase